MDALETEGETPSQRPSLPTSTEVMCRQAADAVMRAYRDGFTRQTIRLRLDAVYDGQDLYNKGLGYLLQKALPLVKSFARKLWNGEYVRELKTSIFDEEVGTLVYREAENPMMDAAVFFLPGRDFVISDKFQRFYKNMGDRLVVLANTEQAPANWKVENRGRDFYLVSEANLGYEVSEIFREQSYYYYQLPLNNWQLAYFRAYPHPWEVWIEDLDYNLVKLGESDEKPRYEQIIAWMQEYEEKNDIPPYKKIGKYLKDNAEGSMGL